MKKGGKIVVANGREQTIFEALGWRDGSEENRMWCGLNKPWIEYIGGLL
jgi:hypothetical protein